MITTMPELTGFRPTTPLVYPAAHNNLGASWATTFMAPAYLWYRMEDLKTKRGSNAPNLSSFMREAVQTLLDNPELALAGPEPVAYRQPPLFNAMFGEPGEKWQFNFPILTITLLDSQKEPFDRLLADSGLTARGSMGRLLCKAFIIQSDLEQEKLPGWQDYLDFIQPWAARDRAEVRHRLIGLERDGYAVNLLKDS